MNHAKASSARSIDANPLATASILIVDADDDTRAAYRQSIQACGCEIVEASDGRDALAQAMARPPRLVITALNLPLIDGSALCEILRRDHVTAHVPILVITDAPPAEIDRARRVGADAVLVKPATSEQILFETRRLMTDARAVRGRAVATRVSAIVQRPQATQQRTRLSKTFVRFTTMTPPAAPPELRCPSCDELLTYEKSYVGGVSEKHSEQWDDYRCLGACGMFQYRHRTRKLRNCTASA